MAKFNLHPLCLALLGATSTAVFANTSTDATSTHQLPQLWFQRQVLNKKLKNAPASISVISAEDLKNKRINSIADALVDVEGVDISPTAGKTGGLNIRIRGWMLNIRWYLLMAAAKTVQVILPLMVLVNRITVLFRQFQQLNEFEIIRGPALPFMVQMLLVVLSISSPKKCHRDGSRCCHTRGYINSQTYSDFGNQRSSRCLRYWSFNSKFTWHSTTWP